MLAGRVAWLGYQLLVFDWNYQKPPVSPGAKEKEYE